MGAVEIPPGYATPIHQGSASFAASRSPIPVFDIQFDRDVYEFSVDDV